MDLQNNLRAGLADDLNKLIQNGQMLAPHTFSDPKLSGATRKLLEQKPTGANLVRLNRLRLQDAYPSEISRDLGNFMLVLGNHPSNRAALVAINKAIFRRITDLLLTQSDEHNHSVTGRKTWLFIDEAREAGALDGLSSLLNQGRSKGVCTVLGFQDIEGLRAVYGQSLASELVGECDNKTVLRTDSAVTAKWAEEHFGQSLIREYTQNESESRSAQGPSTTRGTTEHVQMRPEVLASEFMDIPRTGPDYGLLACNDSPIHGAYWDRLKWEKIEERRNQLLPGRCCPIEDVPGEKPQASQYQFMNQWGTDDDEKFPKLKTASKPAETTNAGKEAEKEKKSTISARRKTH
jgi:hypothetical protein